MGGAGAEARVIANRMQISRWKWVALLSVGMVVGLALAQILSVSRVNAQARQWRECFAATLWSGSGRSLSSGEIPQRVQIPAGWTPVGGTSVAERGATYPAVVICR